MTLSPSSLPRLTLITVTYNAASVLDDFWTSLKAQRGVDWSLIIVDNASVDGTLDKLATIEQDQRVTVIRCTENTGAAEGNNIGLRHALRNTQDYIVLCNNDILFGPDILQDLARAKHALPLGAVTPLMVFEDDRTAMWFERGEIRTRFGVRCLHVAAGDSPALSVYPTDYAPTTFVLFDRAAIKAVGEIDKGYFAYWEDADYMWRLRRAGYGIWVNASTTIVHKVSQSSGGFGSIYSNRQYHKNQLRFARKHFGAGTVTLTAASSLARIAVRALLRLDPPSMTKAKLRGMWDGASAPALLPSSHVGRF
ncbi:glycosyltransferase family 2 protein [Sphingomonas fuzhouensis]|uniref:glycosyltransferase family 2 protein n=1 Tax=Sphingomonas fuzhouensis TaxID=3106033 RepID=UPI002AFEE572|nr:glycosyltransferase family 2 protein [Sphingomonas sp. SGZ-02]